VNAAITVLTVLGLITGLVFMIEAAKKNSTRDENADSAWEAALYTEGSQVGKILLRVSRPMSNLPQIYNAHHGPTYRGLYNKVLASGTYGGSLEVYLAVQSMAAFIGMVTIIGAVLSGQRGMDLMAFTGLGIGIAALPYNQIAKKAKARLEAVEAEMPVFAELVLMPLEAGMTPLSAMNFTSHKLDGPVAQEVRNLQTVIDSRAMDEAQAFQLAAARLGTPEANQFMTALMQAHLDGAKVLRNLQSQAEALRMAAHQRRRENMKKLPVKLVMIFSLHLIPALFVVTLVPTFTAMANM
jgi:pilus assembly protein TadC